MKEKKEEPVELEEIVFGFTPQKAKQSSATIQSFKLQGPIENVEVPHFNEDEHAYTPFEENKSSNLLPHSSRQEHSDPIYKTSPYISRSATRLQDDRLTEMSNNGGDHSVGKERRQRGGGRRKRMKEEKPSSTRAKDYQIPKGTNKEEMTPDEEEVDYRDYM